MKIDPNVPLVLFYRKCTPQMGDDGVEPPITTIEKIVITDTAQLRDAIEMVNKTRKDNEELMPIGGLDLPQHEIGIQLLFYLAITNGFSPQFSVNADADFIDRVVAAFETCLESN